MRRRRKKGEGGYKSLLLCIDLEDPLARSVRKKLKKLGILSGIQVAYSTEKPSHVKLLPLGEIEKGCV
jgi:hypothetical protein